MCAMHHIMTVTGTLHQGHEPTWNIGNTVNPLVNIKSHTPWELASPGCVRPHAVEWCIFPCLGGSIAGTLQIMSVQSIAFNTRAGTIAQTSGGCPQRGGGDDEPP
jgi:hypothetical protein